MAEEEHYEWRLFYPLDDDDHLDENRAHKKISSVAVATEKSVLPFTLATKLNMLSVTDDRHSRRTTHLDVYLPLGTVDVCLKIRDIENNEKLSSLKLELELRNLHKEQPSMLLFQHWSIYELKYPRVELSEKILSRLNPLVVEKILKYVKIIVDEERKHLESPSIHETMLSSRGQSALLKSVLQQLRMQENLSYIKMRKSAIVWQMDDSDRVIEQTDICLIIDDSSAIQLNLTKEPSETRSQTSENQLTFVPEYWRVISIQTGDISKLVKTLMTLQIENDKNLLDYFSLLIAQTRLNSVSSHRSLLSTSHVISPEKAYVQLLTMSYAAFVELIGRIQTDQTSQSLNRPSNKDASIKSMIRHNGVIE